MKPRITRRRLIAGTAGFGAGVLILPDLNTRAYAANDKLNLALVGCGNRGGNLLDSYLRIGENVVALCDVNQQKAGDAYSRFPEVPKFHDFRKMLDKMGNRIDAVVVATPDHTHAAASADPPANRRHVPVVPAGLLTPVLAGPAPPPTV